MREKRRASIGNWENQALLCENKMDCAHTNVVRGKAALTVWNGSHYYIKSVAEKIFKVVIIRVVSGDDMSSVHDSRDQFL